MRSRIALALIAFASFPLAAVAVDRPLGGDRLVLKDTSPERRAIRFKAGRDLAVDPLLVDPSADGASLEIFGNGPGDGASGTIILDVGLWKGLGNPAGSKGYRYIDPEQTTGIRKLVLKKGTIAIAGGGTNWLYAITQPQAAIDLRLETGDDVFCARFTDFVRNEAERVIARGAPAPASCGAAVCGDGIAQGSEECDDGGTADGDGCSASCLLEDTSALCAGVPSMPGTGLDGVLIASGLDTPVHITAPRLDPLRLFVTEQAGFVRVIRNGILQPKPFLAISERVQLSLEEGLLSVAFHPDYETNGRFFVYYVNNDGNLVIARYQVTANPEDADESSERILLTIPHIFWGNHNGGQLAFGPDGYLYAGTGDGGGGGDPGEHAQNDASLLGKILRIDVDVDSPPYYAVPPSNPNAGAGDPLGLIWAKGVRNPWRFSFDRATFDVYIGDVGQNAFEEVNVQPAASPGGENYGWDVFEARHCYEPDPPPDCPDPPTGFTMPVLEYSHAEGCSVTGGFVYRGCRMPDVAGTYFYSDYCTAFVRTFAGVLGGDAQNLQDRTADVAPGGNLSIGSVLSFGEDARGELYIADADGEIYRISPGN